MAKKRILKKIRRMFASAEDYDSEQACMGALECMQSGLGRAAFAGRILSQLGGVERACLRSYLLGAVLMQDVIALRTFMAGQQDATVYVAGKMPLQRAFCDVLRASKLPEAVQVPMDATRRMGVEGAMQIAGI